jgi:hypothetical protein
MPAGPKVWTEEVIARRIKEGRGQGDGVVYTPWLYVQEFSSSGTQTRIPSPLIGRTIHTFSYIERALFLWLEFLGSLLGYKEQFPMERQITLAIAAALRIKHPKYPRSTVPVVMTLDALAWQARPDGTSYVTAYDAKPSSKLRDRRVMEKLTLHKGYCAHFGIPHQIFTEQSVPKNVIRNIDMIRGARRKEGELELVPGLFDVHPQLMLDEISFKTPAKSIREFCAAYDTRHRLPKGAALRVFKILLWRHKLNVDLNVKELVLQPVPAVPKRPAAGGLRRTA